MDTIKEIGQKIYRLLKPSTNISRINELLVTFVNSWSSFVDSNLNKKSTSQYQTLKVYLGFKPTTIIYIANSLFRSDTGGNL